MNFKISKILEKHFQRNFQTNFWKHFKRRSYSQEKRTRNYRSVFQTYCSRNSTNFPFFFLKEFAKCIRKNAEKNSRLFIEGIKEKNNISKVEEMPKKLHNKFRKELPIKLLKKITKELKNKTSQKFPKQ